MPPVRNQKRCFSGFPKKCGHCDKLLNKSSYYKHKQEFFDAGNQQWGRSNSESPGMQYSSQQSLQMMDREFGTNEPRLTAEAETNHYEKIRVKACEGMQEASDITEQLREGLLTSTVAEEKLLQLQIQMDGLDCLSIAEKKIRKTTITGIEKCIEICTSLGDQDQSAESSEEDSDGVLEDCEIEKEAVHSDSMQGDINSDFEEDNQIMQMSESKAANKARLLTIFLFTWQRVFNISSRALQVLLLFLQMFISDVANNLAISELIQLSNSIPKSLYMGKQFLGVSDNFRKYVVCSKCHSLYDFDSCFIERSNGTKIILKCKYVEFPDHSQKRFRNECGEKLLKEVKTLTGTTLEPFKMYCYKSIKESLSHLVSKPGFVDICQKWRTRQIEENTFADIYDGNMWKEEVDSGYLNADTNFLCTMNIDWFQPYSHSPCSVGAIYLVINNLPRDLRFLEENMILVGVIPGPSEPKKNMNSYLSPMVNELQELETGCFLKDFSDFGNFYRFKLNCISCDIPATRKCGGFVGHGALRGCSKCLRKFPRESFGSKADYSGIELNEDELRGDEVHVSYGKKALNSKTLAEAKLIESEYGARWSELFKLSYYLPVRMSMIDPLHNLLLGSAKHIVKVWKENGILDDKKLTEIQDVVDNVQVPSDIGRIPRKIASGFSGFTGDQWKNFTLIYSLVALKGRIPDKDYKCWSLFVRACSTLCSRVISRQRVEEADRYLKLFCKQFEILYGKENCTMNMHLHLHLKDCIFDFGPIYSFWCFAFERFNGILGSIPNNNHSIELQIMRYFTRGQCIDAFNWPADTSEYSSLLHDANKQQGSLFETNQNSGVALTQCSLDQFEDGKLDFRKNDCINIVGKGKKHVFDSVDIEYLKTMFTTIYPSFLVKCIDRVSERYSKVHFGGDSYSVSNSKGGKSSVVSAKWIGNRPETNIPDINSSSEEFRSGVIKDIYVIEAVLSKGGIEEKCEHVLARVEWFEKHPSQHYFGHLVDVWRKQNENESCAQFIPVQRIYGRCALTSLQVPLVVGSSSTEMARLTIPIKQKFNL